MFSNFSEYVSDLEKKISAKAKELNLFNREMYTQEEAATLAAITASLAVLAGVSEVVTDAISNIEEYLESE